MMKQRNLYIVNTPFQLLTSYILAAGVFEQCENQLLLLHPHSFARWESTFGLNKMAADQEVWQQVDVFPNWLGRKTSLVDYRSQISQMQKALLKGGEIHQVFLGSDKVLQNQLAVEVCGNTNFARLDEGLGSYINEDKSSAISRLWRFLRIRFLRLISGLDTDMQYNYRGLGASPAATADYLYQPKLLKRFSPDPVEISRKTVKAVINRATHEMPRSTLFKEPCMVFLSSPLVEMKFISMERELAVLANVVKMAERVGIKFVYKRHPAEDQQKLALYQKSLPEMLFLDCIEPIELYLHREPNIRYLTSYCSSGLLNTNVFSAHGCNPICLLHLYEGCKPADITSVFAEAGISLPNTIADLENVISKGN